MRTRIGECLVQAGLISSRQLRKALAERKRTGERLGIVLVRMTLATEEQIAKTLAVQLGFPYVSLADDLPEPSAVALVPKSIALKRVCIGVAVKKKVLTVAMDDPLSFSVIHDLEERTGFHIKQVVSTRSEILDAIHNSYPDEAAGRASGPDAAIESEDPCAIGSQGDEAELTRRILQSAIETQASDIHVEPTESGVRIRLRVDGVLKEVMILPRPVHAGLTARLKGLAGVDVAETRLPQDGRMRVPAGGGPESRDVDFRLSTLPTLFGEKVVMRRLALRKEVPALEDLGMSPFALEQTRQLLRSQHGILLAVGPTGSGKTTTLSAALSAVKSENTNIVTIEDPIEYQIPGVNQTQIDETIQLTFAGALRAALGQDADVILVGEINAADTAAVATRAAQTGHLILSTLDADDAASSVTRLGDLGIEPSVVASELRGVVAQRLVRRLCVRCRRQYTPPEKLFRSLGISDSEGIAFYAAVGCDQCAYTGYRGRIGIYEVMRVTEALRRLLSSRAPAAEIRQQAIADGMVTLAEDGLAKVKSGVTTADELQRVVTVLGEVRTLCAGCGTAVAADFTACPACGKRIAGACSHCGRALRPGWNFCPYCARGGGVRTVRKGLNIAEFPKA